MNEHNIKSGIIASMLSSAFEFARPLQWLFLLGVVLIAVDLRFGIRASRHRGEEIRFSRAVRRSMNKVVDYLCWVLLAGGIDVTFGEPIGVTILPIVVMLVIYGVEINSCFSNYFEVKGAKVKVDIFRWFARKVDIIEVERDEKE